MRLMIIGGLGGQVGAASRIAIERGAKVMHADDIDSGLATLRGGQGADLVLVDVKLDVGQLLERLRGERFAVPVVACGVGNDSKAAVNAIRAGAKEYLPLPPDPELIAAILAAVSEDSHAIVHADPKMRQLLQLAERVAASDASVLISGPSGTGKELLARYLHGRSRRSKGRFVALNCAAIPETLLESELFGHEKGAFTGAVARRLGRFEEANGGTLLLDEISEMELRLQAKLLRAIQEREIDRLGGSTPVKIDVRILATSNRDLADAVAHGTFRADLYFRLNVVNLTLPPLAERPGDIVVLARHFITKYAAANGVEPMALDREVERRLLAHAWPGNVRELENAMHRAVLLADGATIDAGAILLGDTPVRSCGGGQAGAGSTQGLVGRSVADVERDLIIDTVRHCLGNRTHAATVLGISIRTLRNKLREYSSDGISVPPPSQG